MAATPEKRLVERIKRAILTEWPSAWVTKIAGGAWQSVGLPDLMVVVDGRFIGLEVKARYASESEEHVLSRVTPTQHATIDRIRHAGGIAGCAWTVEGALALVRQALPPEGDFCDECGADISTEPRLVGPRHQRSCSLYEPANVLRLGGTSNTELPGDEAGYQTPSEPTEG